MRRLALGLLALAGLAGFLLFNKAHASDTYRETLAPGADAGSLASATVSVSGVQFMLRCTTHPVTYKICNAGVACAATANDSPIDADQSIDVCGLQGWSQLSVFRAYDGGVGACRLYYVNPVAPGCKP